jgi:hypothetical protein
MLDLLQRDVLLGLAILFAPVAVEAFKQDWKVGTIAVLLVVALVGARTALKYLATKKP